MRLTQEQIEKLRTLQESYDVLADTLIIDPVAKESSLVQGIADIKSSVENIDLTPVETKVDEGVADIKKKIDNIKLPEINTTELAKQGDNPEATNSKILEEVQKIPNLKNIYSARFEKNDDNINTYTMILPIIAGVEGDTIIL
jgi:hypothetical protein